MTGAGAVDCYLGDPMLVPLLEAVDFAGVARVICHDPRLVERLAPRIGDTMAGDANALTFEPSPIGIALHYPVPIRPPLLARYRALYNLHPGYLPWARGPDPVFWTMWERASAGATLHRMVEALDAGPIVDQVRVAYRESDAPNDVWYRLREAERTLFLRYWPALVRGEVPAETPQPPGGFHRTRRDLERLLARAASEDGRGSMTAAELLRLAQIAGRTEIAIDGRRYVMRVAPQDVREKVRFGG
jgi:hypothetical protein